MRVPALLLLAAAACAGDATPVTPEPTRSLTLEHDFGTVPHGQQRVHEWALDLSALPEPHVPLRVHLDCSCGHADLRIRHRNGTERFVDHSGAASNLPGPDEAVVVHLELDTTRREAADLPPTVSRGFVVLQALSDRTGMSRVQWPMLVRFGIDAPVELRPFAQLDFGRVPQSFSPIALTTLRGDERHRDMTFGPVECSDERLTVTLEPGDGHTVLRTHCRPNALGNDRTLGNHRALVTVHTSLDGYRVPIQATWKVVPDLEATPMDKISFQVVAGVEQTARDVERQFVLVTDHDVRRPREFVVDALVDDAGNDRREHFEVSFLPLGDDTRQLRLQVRYRGGLDRDFRGRILLGKPGGDGPQLPIELVVFVKKHP
jgi:hypothetical protein